MIHYGEPASLSPAPALLRGAITVGSTELGLPASDQTPVCFYRCSTAHWEHPPVRSHSGGKNKLRRHDGWKAGLLLYMVWCCPPDNNASVPARPMTPHTLQYHPNLASCCWGATSRSLACVFPPSDRGCELQQLRGQHMALSITSLEVKKRERCKAQPLSLYHLERNEREWLTFTVVLCS